MKLIDKEKVVAEIERQIKVYSKLKKEYPTCEEYYEGEVDVLENLRDEFLNTLEVKEIDLENSMVCKVDWYDGFLLDYTQEQQDELLEKIGADVGDKIRVLLIKE